MGVTKLECKKSLKKAVRAPFSSGESIDRELELLEFSKMIDEDSTAVVSEFRNDPPDADDDDNALLYRERSLQPF